MVSSAEETDTATRILDQLLGALSPEGIRHAVDAPMDRALASHEWPRGPCTSQAAMLEHAGRLLRHLHAHGMMARPLTSKQARAEAARILHDRYINGEARGFTAALLDLHGEGQGGINIVLTTLADIVRREMRDRYVRGVIAELVDPLDWPMKCRLARQVLTRFRRHLPGALASVDEEQFAEACPALVLRYAETGQVFVGSAGSASWV